MRVRLFMPDGEHQIVNIALAGVRSARASSKQGEPSEPWGEEVRFSNPVQERFADILVGKILHRISVASEASASANPLSA